MPAPHGPDPSPRVPLKERTTRAIEGFTRRRLSRPSLQGFWSWVVVLGLNGMNIGGGGQVEESGERAVMERLRRAWERAGPERPVVFDVGANRGHYTQAALRHLPASTLIHAFEPSAACLRELRVAFEREPRVRIVPKALSSGPGVATLYADHEGSGLGSLHARRLEHEGIESRPVEEVGLTTLDAYCGEAGVDRIDLLKLDVEGHEMQVLEGARKMMERGAIGAIQMEFGGCNIDSRTFFRDFWHLLSPTHEFHRILPKGLAPIRHYRAVHEVFVTTNFLALPRGAAI